MTEEIIKEFRFEPIIEISIEQMMEMDLTLLQNWLFQLEYDGAIIILNKYSICRNIWEFNRRFKWN